MYIHTVYMYMYVSRLAEIDLGNERAAKYYLGLYRRMEKYGRDTYVLALAT